METTVIVEQKTLTVFSTITVVACTAFGKITLGVKLKSIVSGYLARMDPWTVRYEQTRLTDL